MLEVVFLKISADNIKNLISLLGYKPENGTNDVYYKKYSNHNSYIIRINFNTQKIEYRSFDIEEEKGIRWGDSTTSNFENSENFVVLECVDRLLEKGYAPHNIYLEYKFHLGRNEKGKLDILVFNNDEKAYLMIECKTWGTEFSKEQKKMQKDGGQLFSYYVQDKATNYLCLYTSHLSHEIIEYKNDIIKADEIWTELSNQKEIHDHWNKNVKDNGIFEEWANAYDIEIKALVRARLQPLTKDDSGRIFNQFAEILRHNVVSDKPNAFNKILNLFICKIIDEDKNDTEQVEFQWLEYDTNESLQLRLNDLYKKGMHRFLDIDVTDFTERDISDTLVNINDSQAQKSIRNMIIKLRLQKNPEFAFIEVYDENSFKRNARIVREVVELLQPYQFRYGHKQQFLGDFFELLLNTSIKQEAGQFFTPVPITRYIVSSLPIKEFIEKRLKTDDPSILPTVVDFACGTGHFLTEFMDRVQTIIETEIDSKNAKPTARKKLRYWAGDDGKFEWASDFVYGIDADYRLVKSSKVSSFLNGDGEANIIRANGLDHFYYSKEYKGKLKISTNDDNKDNGQFDILIANPPYSVSSFKSTVKYGEDSFELFNKLTDNSSEIECLFVERMKQLLKVGGYAGIILPSSILNNSGIYTAAREIILRYFKVIGITELGTNTFMATGTTTVVLFLERRPNNDYKKIANAIKGFFERPKDMTVLGIERAFSKYITETFNGISFDDYVSFVSRKSNETFKSQEIWHDYKNWFYNLSEVKKLQTRKQFKEKSDTEQQVELQKLLYDKVFSIEKEKILYFLLTYSQETVLVKVGEKQAGKDFLGYEFSNRRGHEGIKMLPRGTKLYDEVDSLNPQKASSYIYSAFLNRDLLIDNKMSNNVFKEATYKLIDFETIQFEKTVNINRRKKLNHKWNSVKLGSICSIFNGGTPNTSIADYWDGDINWATLVDTKGKYLYSTERKITKLGVKNSNAVILPVNTVLFSSRATIGSISIAKVETCTNQGYKNFICEQDKIIPEYLYYILQAETSNIEDLCNGMTYKEISKEAISNYKIPLPPVDIQEKIVAEINAIETVEFDTQSKIGNLRKNLLIPDYFDYPTERIEKISIMIQRGKSAAYGKSGIQIIKSGQARGYMEFDFSNRYFVSDSFISDERNLQKGDILVNSTGVGTAGRVTLFDLDGDYVVDSHITIIRLDSNIATPKYVLYALSNIGFKNIEAMANGQSGQIELTLPTINAIRIPLPPLPKQQEIVSQIEVLEKKIQILETKISNTKERKKVILDKYLL